MHKSLLAICPVLLLTACSGGGPSEKDIARAMSENFRVNLGTFAVEKKACTKATEDGFEYTCRVNSWYLDPKTGQHSSKLLTQDDTLRLVRQSNGTWFMK